MGAWCVIHLRFEAALEDAFSAILEDLGSAGWESQPEPPRDVRVLAYWREPAPTGLIEQLRTRLEILAARMGAPAPAPPAAAAVPEEDWEASWRRHFGIERPVPGLVVHPSWISYEVRPEETAIVIDPKMAFGVGSHATTQLCLRLIQGVCEGKRVLDVGAGTGILSIAAARWGACEVVAVEHDFVAVANALENVAANAAGERVRIIEGTVEDAPGVFDLAVANLLSSELIPVVGALTERLSLGGLLVVSGILTSEREAVASLLRSEGFVIETSEISGQWAALVARRAQTSITNPS